MESPSRRLSKRVIQQGQMTTRSQSHQPRDQAVKQLTPRSPRSPRSLSPSDQDEAFEDGPTIQPLYHEEEQQWGLGENSSYYLALENPPNTPQQVMLQVSTSPPDLITPSQQATTQSPFAYTTPSDQEEALNHSLQGFMESLKVKKGEGKGKQPVR